MHPSRLSGQCIKKDMMMRVLTLEWQDPSGWRHNQLEGADTLHPQLVLYFAAPKTLGGLGQNPPSIDAWHSLRQRYPKAHLVGCSTGGEILNGETLDDTLVAVAIEFAHTKLQFAVQNITSTDDSFAAGQSLATQIPPEGLKLLFLLCDGTKVNGSALIEGCRQILGDHVTITGGLAGDGPNFQQTLVGMDNFPKPGQIVAIGFYGERLKIGHGSYGGWDRFGPERLITKARGHVLYELDGEPALDLYKRYLGEEAAGLPGSALLFPLAIRPDLHAKGEVVRTVVGIDEAEKAMIFAGDVPVGHIAQLMRGNFDHLVDGAMRAAEATQGAGSPGLALLISCIGRKLLMGQRIIEEVEAVCEVLGPLMQTIGFYSYGEISPHGQTKRCELHNQTMTITTLVEI
jgi:hypothetical protein